MATAEERINGQATQDLIDIGVKPGIARRIVALKGDPSDSKLFAGVAADIRGRSKTRARALWQRRNDLAAAEARFVGLQADLEAKQLASIPAWERRLANHCKEVRPRGRMLVSVGKISPVTRKNSPEGYMTLLLRGSNKSEVAEYQKPMIGKATT